MKQSKPKQLKAFGQAVRVNRLQLRMSQEDLAHACSLDRTYIGSVERGERNISLANIIRLAKALHITPAALLEGIE